MERLWKKWLSAICPAVIKLLFQGLEQVVVWFFTYTSILITVLLLLLFLLVLLLVRPLRSLEKHRGIILTLKVSAKALEVCWCRVFSFLFRFHPSATPPQHHVSSGGRQILGMTAISVHGGGESYKTESQCELLYQRLHH